MRAFSRLVGNLLLALTATGFAWLAWIYLEDSHPQAAEPVAALQRQAVSDPSVAAQPGARPDPSMLVAASEQAFGAVDGPTGSAAIPDLPALSITRVVVPSISLDAPVVTSRLVSRDGGTTWEASAFKAGHAQGTAGPGEAGNAVLLGHVSSRNAGNVFQDLHRVRVGDQVQLFGEAEGFEYRVVEVRSVGRDDVSVLTSTEAPSASLITCTGLWLPLMGDYTERLVVRAQLAS